MILVVALVACGGNKSTELEKQRKLEELVARGPYIDVVPSDLYGAYEHNSVNADGLYKDKVLRVVGMADRVGQDADGTPLVYLRDYHHSSSDPSTIVCAWHDRASAARIDRGPRLVVHGIGIGTVGNVPALLLCDLDTSGWQEPPAKSEPTVDTSTSPYFFTNNIEMFLRGKDIKKFKVSYAGKDGYDVTVETESCDRARLAVTQLGIPRGASVKCTNAGVVQWTLKN